MIYNVMVFYKEKSCEFRFMSLATIAVLLQTDKDVTRVIVSLNAADPQGIMLFPADWTKIVLKE